MFEHTCHGDPFHVAKGTIEKEFAQTGRYKIPEALREACREELWFLNKLAWEELQYKKLKRWSRKKQIELEHYYMYEWGTIQQKLCQAIALGSIVAIQDNVTRLRSFFAHLTHISLMEYELGWTWEDSASEYS